MKAGIIPATPTTSMIKGRNTYRPFDISTQSSPQDQSCAFLFLSCTSGNKPKAQRNSSRYHVIEHFPALRFVVTNMQAMSAFEYIDNDAASLRSSLDPFTVTKSSGFLPCRLPTFDLPDHFRPLSTLLANMPVTKLDGTQGLLASFKLGHAIDVDHILPDMSDEIAQVCAVDGLPDLEVVTALFRDYSFLASAYLLEPCYERHAKGMEGYGLGRSNLPWVIAGPLVQCAKM